LQFDYTAFDLMLATLVESFHPVIYWMLNKDKWCSRTLRALSGMQLIWKIAVYLSMRYLVFFDRYFPSRLTRRAIWVLTLADTSISLYIRGGNFLIY